MNNFKSIVFWKKSKLLILYSTIDGHTKEICEYIYKKLKGKKKVNIISIEEYRKYDLSDYDELVIGASVRYGYHRENVNKFIQENIEKIDKLKTVFFSLNLTARKPEKSTPETNPYVKKFLKKANWEPTLKEVFAGRLDYPSLDPFNRLAILFIMLITDGPKDTSKTYELTDWKKVEKLIKSISKL